MSLPRGRMWIRLASVAAGALLLSPGWAYAADHRFAVSERLEVRPGEVLESVTCFLCEITVHDGGAISGAAVVVVGRLLNHGEIGGDTVMLGGTVHSEGTVRGNAVVVAGSLILAGEVGGSVMSILGDTVADGRQVRINGDLISVLGLQDGVREQAIGGTVQHFGKRRVGLLVASGVIGALSLSAVAVLSILAALNTLLYFLLGTRRLEVLAATVREKAHSCFLHGLGTCFALVVAGLIVILLLPVSVPLLVVLLVLSAAGYSGVSYLVGRNLFGRLGTLAATSAGAVLIISVQLVPVLGWLVMAVLWSIAIGSVVLSGFGTSTDWLETRGASGSEHRAAQP